VNSSEPTHFFVQETNDVIN